MLASRAALALDAFEIQVYDDRMNRPRELSTEVHANVTTAGRRDADYPGEIAPHHMTRLTLEPAFGVTPYWELGAYLQTARAANGELHYAGTKLRSKLLLPRASDAACYFGVNLELSRIPVKFEPSRWGTELRPIAGWRAGRWLAIVNPILTWSLSGDERNEAPDFEPAAKLEFDTRHGFGLGAEYYAGLGRIDRMPRTAEQEHVLYAVFDLLNRAIEWNLGVGRGLTPATNDWTIKTIVGRAF